jgi:hypothetical protein
MLFVASMWLRLFVKNDPSGDRLPPDLLVYFGGNQDSVMLSSSMEKLAMHAFKFFNLNVLLTSPWPSPYCNYSTYCTVLRRNQ